MPVEDTSIVRDVKLSMKSRIWPISIEHVVGANLNLGESQCACVRVHQSYRNTSGLVTSYCFRLQIHVNRKLLCDKAVLRDQDVCQGMEMLNA